MNQFTHYRFLTNNMLTTELMQHKDKIIRSTEDVIDAKGIHCDSKISKISLEQLTQILDEVRKYKKDKKIRIKRSSPYRETIQGEEIQYIK